MSGTVQQFEFEVERRAELFLKTERELLVEASSQQDAEKTPGQQWIPQVVNFKELQSFRDPYHTAALQALARCSVGLGLVDGPKEADLPGNPHESFYDIVGELADDLVSLGNGYVEVTRDTQKKPRGLWWLPGAQTEIHASRVLYRQVGTGAAKSTPSYFRLFGVQNPPAGLTDRDWGGGPWEDLHEVIHFRLPSTWSTFYGGPSYLGCLKSVMLADAARTWNADFFANGLKVGGIVGVAKKLQSRKELEGGWTDEQKRERASWKSEEEQVKDFFDKSKKLGSNESRAWLVISGLGGQQGGSAEKAISFTPLSQAPKDADFVKLLEACRDEVISQHSCPQLLVAVSTPGKLGGGSDAVGQLIIFETMRCSPVRRIVESQFNRTIGPELSMEFKFRGIDDELISQLRTAAGSTAGTTPHQETPTEPTLEQAVSRMEKGIREGEL